MKIYIKEKGNGRDILNTIRSSIITKRFNLPKPLETRFITDDSMQSNLTDIGETVFKPTPTSDLDSYRTINPITQSYMPLVENLTALDYFTHDAFTEAHEKAAYYGTEVDICTYACLGLSYNTMGYFPTKSFFFDNCFQFLHELGQFHQEFDCIFGDDEFVRTTGLFLFIYFVYLKKYETLF